MVRYPKCLFTFLFALVLSALPAGAQNAGLIKGQVTDVSGSAIPGANVTVTGKGAAKTFSTDETGSFTAPALTPGAYTIQITKFGFANYGSKAIAVAAGKTVSLQFPLELQASKQEVTVTSDAVGSVSVDPSNNGGQLVLKGTDLDALPDDPDDLAADLQALAGPSAGPNGGQIYIDGFTGGNLPPKSSIREIRINQNPFSAEYDRLGFGRIEILTKPGTDRFRGSVSFNDSDSVFNSRNPYLVASAQPTALSSALNPGTQVNNNLTPTFSSRLYEGNLGGPMGKKGSFFIDIQKRDIQDNAIINASRLDTNLLPYQYSTAVSTPNNRIDISPRLDYQISTNNTLVVRYSFQQQKQTLAGIGNFTLASQGYNTQTTEHRAQVTETAVLGSKVVNETRFQFLNDTSTQNGDNSLPSINVLQAFNGGGSQVGRSYDLQKHFELQNYTSIAQGTHAIKFGVRIRTVMADDYSPQNFGGTFQFASGVGAPLDANNNIIAGRSGSDYFDRTLSAGRSCSEPNVIHRVILLGCGASQFSIASLATRTLGSTRRMPASFLLDDLAFPAQPDNQSRSYGTRWQNNIGDKKDVRSAPRLRLVARGGKGGPFEDRDSRRNRLFL